MLTIQESRADRDFSLATLVDEFVTRYGKPYFLQVGAYDGVSADPLFPSVTQHSLSGCLLEPQRDAFDRLCENYRRAGQTSCSFVHAAIAPSDGHAILYRIRQDAVSGPEWMHQLATFHKDVLLRHSSHIPDLDSLIVEERVPSTTFDTLFREHGIARVDVLQVDTEGYDARVLELFDIPQRKPGIVSFEHKHLSTRDYLNATSLLCKNGYSVFVNAGRPDDTTAFQKHLFPEKSKLLQ